jgi:hypothetical protein
MVAKIIYDGCDRLKDFANIGRASRRLSGRRELVFPPLPYIAVYQVKGENGWNLADISRGPGLAKMRYRLAPRNRGEKLR